MKQDNFVKEVKPSRKSDTKHIEPVDYGIN